MLYYYSQADYYSQAESRRKTQWNGEMELVIEFNGQFCNVCGHSTLHICNKSELKSTHGSDDKGNLERLPEASNCSLDTKDERPLMRVHR